MGFLGSDPVEGAVRPHAAARGRGSVVMGPFVTHW